MSRRILRRSPLHAVLFAVAACGTLAACNTTQRLAEVGSAPAMTRPVDPTTVPGYRPVSLPMPAPRQTASAPNSLWRAGSRAFLKDQRASRVGDILTVLIEIEDRAELQNRSTRSRNNSESAGLPNFFGLESQLSKVLPESVNPASLVDANAESNSLGTGAVNRRETIELKVAALVTQMMPNGNMVISGRQEVRVNHEMRELLIAGVIRPEDITSGNTIGYEKIAEARISYGGRGTLSDVQQPRYGQQIYDIVSPL